MIVSLMQVILIVEAPVSALLDKLILISDVSYLENGIAQSNPKASFPDTDYAQHQGFESQDTDTFHRQRGYAEVMTSTIGTGMALEYG